MRGLGGWYIFIHIYMPLHYITLLHNLYIPVIWYYRVAGFLFLCPGSKNVERIFTDFFFPIDKSERTTKQRSEGNFFFEIKKKRKKCPVLFLNTSSTESLPVLKTIFIWKPVFFHLPPFQKSLECKLGSPPLSIITNNRIRALYPVPSFPIPIYLYILRLAYTLHHLKWMVLGPYLHVRTPQTSSDPFYHIVFLLLLLLKKWPLFYST